MAEPLALVTGGVTGGLLLLIGVHCCLWRRLCAIFIYEELPETPDQATTSSFDRPGDRLRPCAESPPAGHQVYHLLSPEDTSETVFPDGCLAGCGSPWNTNRSLSSCWWARSRLGRDMQPLVKLHLLPDEQSKTKRETCS